MIQDLINKEYKKVSLQDTETIILLNKSQEELTAMQARIEKLEAGLRRIVNGEYDNARTIDAAEKFARELLRGEK